MNPDIGLAVAIGFLGLLLCLGVQVLIPAKEPKMKKDLKSKPELKVYIATSHKEKHRVHPVFNLLKEAFPKRNVVMTYDWTTNTHADDPELVAYRELEAIESCDLFVALLPGGSGTMTEIGLAAALGETNKGKFVIVVGSVCDPQGWREAPIIHLLPHAPTVEAALVEILIHFKE